VGKDKHRMEIAEERGWYEPSQLISNIRLIDTQNNSYYSLREHAGFFHVLRHDF